MKKILLSLITILMPLALLAQEAGDNFTIKTTDGITTEWSLAGGNKNGDISIIKHNGNKLELYAKGYENTGACQTYNLDKIENITFSVFHKGDYKEESAVNAPKSASSYKGLNEYAQSFVNAVRATGGNNETRNLIINTYAAANGDDVLNNLVIPTDMVDGHIAVEVHTYAPWDWFAQKGKWDASCSNEIKNMFTRLSNKFISKGIPCIIGEYGTHGSKSVSKNSSASEIQAAADQAADIVKQAKAYGVATFYWMSIFTEKDRTVPQWTLPTVVEAMKKAYNE